MNPNSRFSKPFKASQSSTTSTHANPTHDPQSHEALVPSSPKLFQLETEHQPLLSLIKNLESEIVELETSLFELESTNRKSSLPVDGSIAINPSSDPFQFDFNQIIDQLTSLHSLSPPSSKPQTESQDQKDHHPILSPPSLKLIDKLTHFTGIKFFKVSHSSFSNEAKDLIRKFSLKGSSHGLDFAISFLINDSTLQIHQLECELALDIRIELSHYVSSLISNNNLLGLYRCILDYSYLHEKRLEFFFSYLKRFPSKQFKKPERFSIVPISRSSLLFRDKSIEILLVWNIVPNSFNQLISQFHLIPKISEKWKKHDPDRLIKSISSQFDYLIELKGLDVALETILCAVFAIEEISP